MSAHAKLSPSAASRWMVCTKSPSLEENFTDKTSTYAEEGTLAHAVAELILREFRGDITTEVFNWAIELISNAAISCEVIEGFDFASVIKDYQTKVPTLTDGHRIALSCMEGVNPVYYNEALFEYANDFAKFVIEQCTDDYLLLIEERIDMTSYIEEGFGTGDAFILKPKKFIFNDLKFGKGVKVDAYQNKQLMIYALGALNQYGTFYEEIEEVEMNIIQPRLDNISTFTMAVKDLVHWAETELKEKARLAFSGEGEYVPGNHCGFCKARATCRALAEYNLALVAKDFSNPDLLTEEEIVNILERQKLFTSWLTALSEYALIEALGGREFPGMKLVEGRANRKYSSEEAIIEALENQLIDDIYAPKKLLGITLLEKKIGKDEFKEFVAPYVYKPSGKPTLVPVSDKRPVFTGGAVSDFSDIEIAE